MSLPRLPSFSHMIGTGYGDLGLHSLSSAWAVNLQFPEILTLPPVFPWGDKVTGSVLQATGLGPVRTTQTRLSSLLCCYRLRRYHPSTHVGLVGRFALVTWQSRSQYQTTSCLASP
jgi:hypothetical protein